MYYYVGLETLRFILDSKEMINLVKEYMIEGQERMKVSVVNGRKPLEYHVEDKVLLRIYGDQFKVVLRISKELKGRYYRPNVDYHCKALVTHPIHI